jgi:hypothetical protein
MRVVLILDFPEVNANSPEADLLIQSITEDCETMRVAFDAHACWVQEVLQGSGEGE